MAEHKSFLEALGKELAALGQISLRARAGVLDLNPGYLSRVLAGDVYPEKKNVAKIANNLAQARELTGDDRDALWARLKASSENVTLKVALADIKQVRQRFLDRLRNDSSVPEPLAQQALSEATLDTLVRVVDGKEKVKVVLASPGSPAAPTGKGEEQVIALGRLTKAFNAGRRASISVDGEMTEFQRKQILLLAQLVRLVFDDSDEDGTG